jgi:hypothetical protein
MNFKELIEKYKQGNASEEEIKIIEEEIEKYEAIEEYLAGNMELDFISSNEDTENKDESKYLKRSVNRRLRKVILTSVSIVLAIYLGIFYIISPIIDSMYYNPNRITVGEVNDDLYFDLQVFTELNMPGYGLSSPVIAESLGFGNYDIYYGRSKQFTQEKEVLNMKIKRGKLTHLTESLYPEVFINFLTYTQPEVFDENSIERKNERVMSHLKQLNPVSYVAAYLTFDRDLTMEEFRELEWDYPVRFIWAGIRTEPEDEEYKKITGFRIDNNFVSQSGDSPDKEKYPAFDYHEWLRDNGGVTTVSNTPKAYELHYKSLLRYMVDREEAVLTFEMMPIKYEYYKSALKYVEENGVNTYGVLVFANPDDLIDLVENGPIENLEIDEVLASRRYIH